jgi:predicted ribosomally synthesized peptide with nif11-like leader
MEKVKEFYDALASDEALRKRAEALNEKLGEQSGEDEAKAEIIAFAKAEGYDFTAEELDAYAKQAKALSDDELETVAGGAYNPNDCFCAVGGGGKDSATGRTCACPWIGGGKPDDDGRGLACAWAGWVS